MNITFKPQIINFQARHTTKNKKPDPLDKADSYI